MTAKARRNPAAELQSHLSNAIGVQADRPDDAPAPSPSKPAKTSAQAIALLDRSHQAEGASVYKLVLAEALVQ